MRSHIAFSRDSNIAFVTLQGTSSLVAIDLASGKELRPAGVVNDRCQQLGRAGRGPQHHQVGAGLRRDQQFTEQPGQSLRWSIVCLPGGQRSAVQRRAQERAEVVEDQKVGVEIKTSPFALSGTLGVSLGPEVAGKEAPELSDDDVVGLMEPTDRGGRRWASRACTFASIAASSSTSPVPRTTQVSGSSAT